MPDRNRDPKRDRTEEMDREDRQRVRETGPRRGNDVEREDENVGEGGPADEVR